MVQFNFGLGDTSTSGQTNTATQPVPPVDNSTTTQPVQTDALEPSIPNPFSFPAEEQATPAEEAPVATNSEISNESAETKASTEAVNPFASMLGAQDEGTPVSEEKSATEPAEETNIQNISPDAFTPETVEADQEGASTSPAFPDFGDSESQPTEEVSEETSESPAEEQPGIPNIFGDMKTEETPTEEEMENTEEAMGDEGTEEIPAEQNTETEEEFSETPVSEDPLATLSVVKDEIATFVNSKREKIAEYEAQIKEIKKKIREEEKELTAKQESFSQIISEIQGLTNYFEAPKKKTSKTSLKKAV